MTLTSPESIVGDTVGDGLAAPDDGRVAESWLRICAVGDLEPERGRAALIGRVQLALFLLHDGRIHAVSNLDPFSDANVISRGIVGTRGDAPTVASPMYKQIWDLRTGACLEAQGKAPASLATWPVAVHDADVYVKGAWQL